jgi:hypothetical protein
MQWKKTKETSMHKQEDESRADEVLSMQWNRPKEALMHKQRTDRPAADESVVDAVEHTKGDFDAAETEDQSVDKVLSVREKSPK